MNILWIGAGLMGSKMAANLSSKGDDPVFVWNRNPDSPGAKFAANAGCTLLRSLEEGLTQADVVFACVTDGPALQGVLSSERIALLKSGAMAVDCSTAGPDAALVMDQRLTAAGKRFMDAPVTGGDIGAQAGTLTFMAGGNAHDVAEFTPLLLKMGRKIVHAGPVGSGQTLKLINQLLCAENLLAVAEALAAATALGIPAETIVDACGGGAGGSWQLNNLGPRIALRDDAPGFKVAHLSKDLNLLSATLGSRGADLSGLSEVTRAFAVLTGKRFDLGERGTQVLALYLSELRDAMGCIAS